MELFINNKSGAPIYDQIYNQIKQQIISGALYKERYLGYLKAMQRHQLFINESENLTQSMGLDQYKPLVYEYLDHIAASSDAIVCVNDHIASLVLSYCQEHNIRVPDDLYVSGFDDNHEFNNRITLTSVHVNTEHIGTHLANRIVYRLPAFIFYFFLLDFSHEA